MAGGAEEFCSADRVPEDAAKLSQALATTMYRLRESAECEQRKTDHRGYLWGRFRRMYVVKPEFLKERFLTNWYQFQYVYLLSTAVID